MTYSDEEIEAALALLATGLSKLAVSKRTGISRAALRGWAEGTRPRGTADGGADSRCAICLDKPERIPPGPYSYLLGLYLGDGCLSLCPRGVYRLRIACCSAYPDLMDECALAMSDVLPNRVNRSQLMGCHELYSYSKHWICMFPQHGPGRKHERAIVLADWQRRIVDRYPAPFLRGLLHSDGCRILNWVSNTPYPRYHFTNASDDIRALFGRACELLAVDWRPNNARNLSVARRDSVLRLDEFVGPKH